MGGSSTKRQPPSWRRCATFGSSVSLVVAFALATTFWISAQAFLGTLATFVRAFGVGEERPHLQHAHRRQARRVEAVAGDGLQDRAAPLLAAHAVLASRDVDARHQPLQVPLPGPHRGLVEVVQVDDDVPLEAAVEAEVVDVGVAVDDHLDAGHRGVGEIPRHDRGGAPEKRERRRAHACHPERNQVLLPSRVPRDDDIHRARALPWAASTARAPRAGAACAAAHPPSASRPEGPGTAPGRRPRSCARPRGSPPAAR